MTELTWEADTQEVVDLLKKTELPEGTKAEVIGVWVWVTFAEKPSAEIRKILREAGFHWNSKRGAWAHPCGVRSFHSKGQHPRFTYGSEEIL